MSKNAHKDKPKMADKGVGGDPLRKDPMYLPEPKSTEPKSDKKPLTRTDTVSNVDELEIGDNEAMNDLASLPKHFSEQEKYLLELSDLERSQYNNLIQKNIKLRGEVLEVATQLDNLQGKIRTDIMEKLEEKYDNQDEINDLQNQLDQQEMYLEDITGRLHDRRKLVGELLKVSEFQDKENQLVYLKKKINEMNKEKDGLMKIINKQREDLGENEIEKSKKERVGLL